MIQEVTRTLPVTVGKTIPQIDYKCTGSLLRGQGGVKSLLLEGLDRRTCAHLLHGLCRPDVNAGRGGWGQKNTLSLTRIRDMAFAAVAGS